ncbi:MAG: preprotein translocase subunit YajC [Bacteroidaceae bacterium]|nr:preprotein translocase subunit YajC [Bacteroidaceae bacterium]MBR1467818.1 preprotein translocase subunit YajC [Bacteroidaceae bacterium]
MIQFMQATAGNNYSFLIMMVVIFAIMWFFMIRPQQKKQKEIQKFRNSIVSGSHVVTAGGIYGTVVSIDEVNNILVLEVAKNVHIRVDRNSVFQSAQSQENK